MYQVYDDVGERCPFETWEKITTVVHCNCSPRQIIPRPTFYVACLPLTIRLFLKKRDIANGSAGKGIDMGEEFWYICEIFNL